MSATMSDVAQADCISPISERDSFGHFQLQARWIDSRLLQCILNVGHQARIAELAGRNIQGDVDRAARVGLGDI